MGRGFVYILTLASVALAVFGRLGAPRHAEDR